MNTAIAQATARDLQHISDREDHFLHELQVKDQLIPKSTPTSPRTTRHSPQRRQSLVASENQPSTGLRRSNSTSTLFVDSTVSRPNMEDTLRCVALALHYTILDGHRQDDPMLYSGKFDEKRCVPSRRNE